MADVKIYIDNQEVELPVDGMSISSNYSIDSATNIDTAKDNNTRTISIPVTKRNSIIMGFTEDVNVVNPITQRLYNQSEHIGIIEEAGTRIMKGRVRLLDVTGTPWNRQYNICIIGNSKLWVDYMKEAKINELSLPVSCDHVYNKATIDAAADGSKRYVYPLMNTGHGTGKSSGVARIVKIEDFDPFIFIKDLFFDCFTAAGYSLQSAFLNSAFFSKLIVNANVNIKSPETIEASLFKVGMFQTREWFSLTSPNANSDAALIPFDMESGQNIQGEAGDVQDNNNVFDVITHCYQANIQQPIRFCVSIAIQKFYELIVDQNSGALSGFSLYPTSIEVQLVEYTGIYNVNGLPYETIETILWYFSPDTPQNYGTAQSFEGRFTAFIPDPNKKYGIALHFIPGPDSLNPGYYWWLNDVQWSHPMIMMDGTSFWCEVDERPMRDEFIEASTLLPDWNMLDFIKSIRHLFNLKFITDIESRTVYAEPRDLFYLKDVIQNMTGKLDIGKEAIITDVGDDVKKYIKFRYQDDPEDVYVQNLIKANKIIIAEHTAENLNVHSEGEEVLENNLFAATLMDNAPEIGLNQTRIPKIQDAPTEQQRRIYNYKPRILFYAGVKHCNQDDAWIFEGEHRYEFPFAYSVNTEDPNDNSLYFCDMPSNNFGIIRGLFEKYYHNTIKTINESKRIKAYFNINSAFISHFINIDNSIKKDFRAKYYLTLDGENIPCRLENISDYNPSTKNTTAMTFVKDVDRPLVVESPTILGLHPTDNSTDVSMAVAISITISGYIVRGVGFITIYNSNGTIFERMLASSNLISFEYLINPTRTIVHIDRSDSLLPNASYFILIDDGALVTSNGYSFAGIQSHSRWNFTMENKVIQTIDIMPLNNGAPYYQFACGTIESSHGSSQDWNYTRTHPVGDAAHINLTGTNRIYSRYLGAQYYIERGIMYFKTWNIPAAAVVLEASLNLYSIKPIDIGLLNAKLVVRQGTPHLAIIGANDFMQYGTDVYGESQDVPVENTYHKIPFNFTGRQGIVKGGVTKLMIREKEMDEANIPPLPGPPETNSIRIIETYLNDAPLGKQAFLRIKYYI